MNKQSGSDSLTSSLEVKRMEGILQAALYPVEPSAAFVLELKDRLQNSDPQMEPGTEWLRFLVFGGAGLITSLVLIITGIRATNRYRNKLKKPAADAQLSAQVAA
jgi:hypothetical protein